MHDVIDVLPSLRQQPSPLGTIVANVLYRRQTAPSWQKQIAAAAEQVLKQLVLEAMSRPTPSG